MVADATFTVNLDTWKKLSKETQDLMKAITIEIENEANARRAGYLEKTEAALKAKGITFVVFSGAEKDAYLKLANKVGWEYATQKSPDTVAKQKQLLKQ
jgi:TRAP-type C4-dicarboxylate transport system substrate-binding protein